MKNPIQKSVALVLLLLSTTQLVFAQTGVKISASPGTAHPSAMLDIESSSKGLLVPRVNLVSLTDGTNPIASPATGLLVYNLGGGGVAAVGYFYWTGAAWVQLTAGGFSGAGTVHYVTKWTASNALGNSQIYDNGTNVGIGTSSPATLLNLAGAHGSTQLRMTLPATANGGGTGAVNMQLWVSEPGVTWDAGGIGTNVTNDGGSPAGFSRINTALGQSYIRFITNGGGMSFVTTNNAGTNYQTMYLSDGNVRVNNLAGTGLRPVYATASGVLQTAPSATVYGYTGGDQSYTVPGGVTSITVKMWGAGGGGGYFGGWTYGFSGGGGGFTQGTISVSPGQVLTVIVGGGGTGGNVVNTAYSYGGGGRSCNTGSDCRYGGQGGGRSAIRNGGTELMTAGGGGGGGSSRGRSLSNCGGAGGGITGQHGTSDQYNYGHGLGGLPMAGGAGGCDVNACGGYGSQFTGGVPASNAYGGGGGGGWFGGGGGGYNESHTMGGGGGGSGYVGGSGVSNAFTLQGSGVEPAGMWDIHYAQGVGVGGITNGQSVPLQGGHGRVVIIPN